MAKRRATVLTPGGHDVTSAGGGSVHSSGKAEDAGPARLDTSVLCAARSGRAATHPTCRLRTGAS
ncbi:hypothetical protein [Shinella oryzae]|uniref:Uncharacterized protein n=1 Tax=Shinella oryzae TaxID=2871820 RepID=A0ABY9K0U8_9HYPH|nr:hypothetical protein [Shinella oryzae]WLS01575.1 hypothetical protein Q9315_08925 [Shinella oryzae]